MAEFQPVLPEPHPCSATALNVDASAGAEHSRHQVQHRDRQVQENAAHTVPTLPGAIADEFEEKESVGSAVPAPEIDSDDVLEDDFESEDEAVDEPIDRLLVQEFSRIA